MATRSKISRILSATTSTVFSSSSPSFNPIRKSPTFFASGSGHPYSTAASPEVGSDANGLWWKDYEDYRRSLYGGKITHTALFVDAVGTLLVPAQPTAQIYREIGEKYGVKYSEDEILSRYRWAYGQPWGRSRLSTTEKGKLGPFWITEVDNQHPLNVFYTVKLFAFEVWKYVDDGRPFWQYIVTSSTGCSDAQYFEELYNYFMTEKAWKLCDPNAGKVFQALRKAGVKVAIVSNFDTRLKPLLQALNCEHWFDAVAVSAEVAAEKPNPMIFLKACDLLGVEPEDVVHVGDDRRNDIWGARDAGCDAWLWGSDVHSFKEVLAL
ncbi:hypothetical protein Cgig2_001444 [Carnegiea gigantea]|uniref:Haloacid dehalogenase-like hydrolase domain-containing protein 3 n=1 Tax=Carnegiea gigantea TaxID=171969 RepID=A0A9Q1QNZ0_9CARY|nr:hypothetical protein Cgig2_001444 [Carnegiea gigantea]